MEFVMVEIPEQIFSASSSTTTTMDDDIMWEDWSPDLSWSNEDFQPLVFASIKSEFNPSSPAASNPSTDSSPHIVQGGSSTTSFDTIISSNANPAMDRCFTITFSDEGNKEERLLHLLTAAAEALPEDCSTRDLARVILVRLKELNNASSSIERLTAHFTVALQALLDGEDPTPRRCEPDKLSCHQYPAGDILTAFHLLQDMSPFASFGHLTVNQAILEASIGERRVHVVDYDIAEGVQWASLIQAMASKSNGGPPPPHLKITALTSGSWRSASVAQEAGRRLSSFAESLGQPFSFRMCRLDQRKQFQPATVKVAKGELVVFNCVLHPAQLGHGHFSSGSVGSFLSGAAAVGARLVTIVEEEGKAGDGEQKGQFFQRFMNELKRYMAVWESLEEGFPKQEKVREFVERVLLGPRIAEALRRAYGRNNSLEATVDGCGKWMAAAGFEKVELSFFNMCQARLLLGLFNDGYGLEEDASNKLVLSWKSCRLLSASVWALPTQRPPCASPPFGSIYL